jgi:hypothetical protein
LRWKEGLTEKGREIRVQILNGILISAERSFRLIKKELATRLGGTEGGGVE